MSDVALPPSLDAPPRKLWAVAAIAALALHLGAVGIASFSGGDDEDDVGAQGIEIGLELTAPRGDVTDLPVGPDSEASAASTAQVEQKPSETESDRPKEIPHESDDPDRLVTTTTQAKPEKDAEKTPVATAASQESVASEASATPTSENLREAEKSVTTAPGTAEAANRVRATWRKELAAQLKRHLRYPAERAKLAASVVITFTIDRAGHLLSSAVAKTSGDSAFDAAALEMLKRADPLPAPPAIEPDLTFTMPVDFTIKNQH